MKPLGIRAEGTQYMVLSTHPPESGTRVATAVLPRGPATGDIDGLLDAWTSDAPQPVRAGWAGGSFWMVGSLLVRDEEGSGRVGQQAPSRLHLNAASRPLCQDASSDRVC